MILLEWVIPTALVCLAGLTLNKKGQEISKRYQQLQKVELDKLEKKGRTKTTRDVKTEPTQAEESHVEVREFELELEETL